MYAAQHLMRSSVGFQCAFSLALTYCGIQLTSQHHGRAARSAIFSFFFNWGIKSLTLSPPGVRVLVRNSKCSYRKHINQKYMLAWVLNRKRKINKANSIIRKSGRAIPWLGKWIPHNCLLECGISGHVDANTVQLISQGNRRCVQH